MCKAKIIVLSDLHGWNDIQIRGFGDVLKLDSRILGNLDLSQDYHQQFINGGIEKAASALLKYEAEALVGLSIGGTIAWRASQKGMKCNRIIALSATRLRYENDKPGCKISLTYGANDAFRPKKDWFERLNLNFQLIPEQGHDFYKELKVLEI